MTDQGITWPGEGRKYQMTRYEYGQAVPPPNWQDRFPGGYTPENPYPDLSADEHFQVWMRTAGLPTFRKLYYRNDNDNMAPGRYSIDVFMSKSHTLPLAFVSAHTDNWLLIRSSSFQTILLHNLMEQNQLSSALYRSLADAILS